MESADRETVPKLQEKDLRTVTSRENEGYFNAFDGVCPQSSYWSVGDFEKRVSALSSLSQFGLSKTAQEALAKRDSQNSSK